MSAAYPHPNQFETTVRPAVTADDDRVEYQFDALVGRRKNTFEFVDYIFETRVSGRLNGAVGTTMIPIHVDEAARRRIQYRDQDQSPVALIYQQAETSQSWSEWIDAQFRRYGDTVIYDNSFEHEYGEVVVEQAASDGLMDAGDIAFVECIGGGRIFDGLDSDSYSRVYDDELLRLIEEAETDGLRDLY